MRHVVRDGSALAAIPAFAALILFLWLLDEYILALQLLFGTIIGFVIVLPIRYLFFKERPQKMSYKSVWSKLDASSFPSLHAYRSGLLTVLLIAYDQVFVVPALLFFAFMLWSRTHLGKHDWTDVSVGAVLGIIAGLLLQ